MDTPKSGEPFVEELPSRHSVLTILDRVDPFAAPADEPPFGERDLRELVELQGAEDVLVNVASAKDEPERRRFAAAEALLAGPFESWRSSPPAHRAVADALAAALVDDSSHNRWGLPGHFVGRLGRALLSLSGGVVDALLPLLDCPEELIVEGSEASTLHSTSRYRVADLAAYLLSLQLEAPWEDHETAEKRDRVIDSLRKRATRG